MERNSSFTKFYPKHVAFIMDGNRRWAKKKKLPIIEGHKKGSEVVRVKLKAGAYPPLTLKIQNKSLVGN